MPNISFNSIVTRTFIERLLAVIILDYIALFAAETLLPGLVMNVLNLNYLLLAILVMVAYLVAVPAGKAEDAAAEARTRTEVVISSVAVAMIAGAAVFALYKVSGWQITLYVTLAVMAGSALYRAITRSQAQA